jgi:hypothetical protein
MEYLIRPKKLRRFGPLVWTATDKGTPAIYTTTTAEFAGSEIPLIPV